MKSRSAFPMPRGLVPEEVPRKAKMTHGKTVGFCVDTPKGALQTIYEDLKSASLAARADRDARIQSHYSPGLGIATGAFSGNSPPSPQRCSAVKK